MPRESVCSIAPSRIFAEGLLLGVPGVGVSASVEVFSVEVFVEQPTSTKLAATTTATAIFRIPTIYPNRLEM